MNRYFIVGLTGQTGAGKTMVSRIFAENGFAVIDCDIVSRSVTETGSDCNKKLSEIFPSCFDDKLMLDRKAMAEIVFNDTQKLRTLNQTIFPFIIKSIESRIEQLSDDGNKFILLDAPTLFEAGADKLCDLIVSCIADKNLRKERIMSRDGITAQLAESRISSQKSDEFFKKHSDYIIENNGSSESALVQTIDIINKIKGKYNG